MPDVEIKEQLDTICRGVTEAQSKITELKERSDTTTAEIKGTVEKITAQAEIAATEMQEHKQKMAAMEESVKSVEKEIIALGSKSAVPGQVVLPEYKNAFAMFMRKNTSISEDIARPAVEALVRKSAYGADEDYVQRQVKDILAGSNPDGGYFISPDRASAMVERIFETSPVRAIANVVNTSSDVWETILDDNEADAGWVGETQSRSKTDTPQIGLEQIPVHEMYANPALTQKAIDDIGFDVEMWLEDKVVDRFRRLENTAFVGGDGVKRPMGFTSFPAWTTAGTYQRSAVEQRSTATASTISADDLIYLMGDLKSDYAMTAQWAMHRTTFFQNVITLKDDNGSYLINPRLIAEGAKLILLGKTVNMFNDMDTVADNALPVVFADWKRFYTVVDRFGIRVLRDAYTNKPYIHYYSTKRVGGSVTNFEAGKILKITAA